MKREPFIDNEKYELIQAAYIKENPTVNESLSIMDASFYDSVWVACLSVLRGNSTDGRILREVIPTVTSGYLGASGRIVFDVNGDRSVGYYVYEAINARAKRYWIDFPFFKPAYRDGRLAEKLRSIIGSYSGWDLVNDDPVIRLKPPASERLGEIAAPTLVIVGELDSLDFHVIADLVSSNVVNAEKCVIMDAGHMSCMEKPEEFNEVVLGFLSRHVFT